MPATAAALPCRAGLRASRRAADATRARARRPPPRLAGWRPALRPQGSWRAAAESAAPLRHPDAALLLQRVQERVPCQVARGLPRTRAPPSPAHLRLRRRTPELQGDHSRPTMLVGRVPEHDARVQAGDIRGALQDRDGRHCLDARQVSPRPPTRPPNRSSSGVAQQHAHAAREDCQELSAPPTSHRMQFGS
eukprot:scaffold34518_cov30-Tisochrysis_lutea.AAC.1